ncbi:hypothetical protein AB6A40_009601 [Gnathostoma spinigerum]|uniref:Glycine-rich protein n=1 Tax=Gnathostoma spinigerum TaxID=75299 RepID=A0ABD6F0Y7_9BILA
MTAKSLILYVLLNCILLETSVHARNVENFFRETILTREKRQWGYGSYGYPFGGYGSYGGGGFYGGYGNGIDNNNGGVDINNINNFDLVF